MSAASLQGRVAPPDACASSRRIRLNRGSIRLRSPRYVRTSARSPPDSAPPHDDDGREETTRRARCDWSVLLEMEALNAGAWARCAHSHSSVCRCGHGRGSHESAHTFLIPSRRVSSLPYPHALIAAHPELQDALAFALRHVATLGPARCTSPVRIVAEKLLEFSQRGALAKGDAGAGDRSDATAATRRAATDAVAAHAGDAAGVEIALPPAAATTDGAEGAEERDERTRALQRASLGRGRRAVVFSEPVRYATPRRTPCMGATRADIPCPLWVAPPQPCIVPVCPAPLRSPRLDEHYKAPVHPKSAAEAGELGAVLGRHILFGGAPEEARAVIVGAMARRDYKAGDVIIKQVRAAARRGRCTAACEGGTHACPSMLAHTRRPTAFPAGRPRRLLLRRGVGQRGRLPRRPRRRADRAPRRRLRRARAAVRRATRRDHHRGGRR